MFKDIENENLLEELSENLSVELELLNKKI